jgi:hypothetical protein
MPWEHALRTIKGIFTMRDFAIRNILQSEQQEIRTRHDVHS